jgi:hypothetical protein
MTRFNGFCTVGSGTRSGSRNSRLLMFWTWAKTNPSFINLGLHPPSLLLCKREYRRNQWGYSLFYKRFKTILGLFFNNLDNNFIFCIGLRKHGEWV